MSFTTRPLITLLAAVVALAPLAAEAQGRHGGRGGGHASHGYRGPGPLFWGLGLGIGLGALVYNSQGAYGAYGTYGTYGPYGAYGPYVSSGPYAYPGVVLAAPPPVVVYGTPIPPAAPAAPAAPDPIIYPRNGQSAEQTEADRQECNRWATTQPSAMADARVFQRATEACLDGRGYTVR